MTRRTFWRGPSAAGARGRPALAAAVALVVLGTLAASAAASPTDGTIAAIRDGDVVLFSADGAWEATLTNDGTAGDPYLSPSQAADGTIAALRHDELTLMENDGTLVRGPVDL